MNQDIIIAVISSSAIGVFISTISQPLVDLIRCKIDIKKANDERDHKLHQELLCKKENTYIRALEYLMRIRRGFDVSDYHLNIAPQRFKEEISETNNLALELGPLIRLYSTDEIFEMFYQLSKWSRYSYSKTRLFENSKENYVLMYNYLSKLMQEDLGYSKGFRQEIAKIACPRCGTIHDFDCPRCPSCKMEFDEMIKLINQKEEEQFEQQNKTEE